MIAYEAKFEPDRKGGFVIRFPDLPNATTQADSLDDAQEMATDALRTLFLGLMRLGEALPAPVKANRGKHFMRITLPALESAKIQLYRTWRASGMRKSQLAAGIGIPRSHVDRLFDLNHASRLNRIEAACRVLGKTLVVDVKDAA